MELVNGLLNYAKPWEMPDVYIFTGNPIVKNNGAIVMGRGAAKQVRDSYPGIDVKLGLFISTHPEQPVQFTPIQGTQYIGWFKVKDHWAEPAKLNLIANSTAVLRQVAESRKDLTFHMNFPGIGNGKLYVEDVMPILDSLPDNVRIYK